MADKRLRAIPYSQYAQQSELAFRVTEAYARELCRCGYMLVGGDELVPPPCLSYAAQETASARAWSRATTVADGGNPK